MSAFGASAACGSASRRAARSAQGRACRLRVRPRTISTAPRAQVDSVYFPQHEVVGDIGNGVWQIKEALLKSPLPTWDLRCAA